MFRSAPPNRKALVVILVTVSSLLIITLGRMQTMEVFSFNPPNFRETIFSLCRFLQISEANQNRHVSWLAPLLKAKDDQVLAGAASHQLIIKDPAQYRCTNIVTVKNRDEGFWKYCGDENVTIRASCLVYSFGINYDFGFDDAMGELGCEVHSFDPSMNAFSHRRSQQVMFYQVGLGEEDTDRYQPGLSQYVNKKTFWKMRTLESLLRESNHLNRTIDLLKIDIEGSEWPVVRNMLDTGVLRHVRQMLLEWHVFPSSPARETFLQLVEVLHNLEKAGFKPFHKNQHPIDLTWDKFNIQSDIGYVNVNFKTS